MISKALGLIETYGYIPAIEAADICLKTANVNLIGIRLVGGGLVTVKICGEVSAVKASIEAGMAAATGVGKVISIDVIARMGIGLEEIIYFDADDINANNNCLDMKKQSNKHAVNDLMDSNTNLEVAQQDIEYEKNKDSTVIQEDITLEERKIDFNGKIISAENTGMLDDIKVVDLRKIARQIKDLAIKRTKIKYAKKDELVKVIKNYLIKKED